MAKLIATLFGESYLGIKEFAGVGIGLVDQGRTALQLMGVMQTGIDYV